MDLDVLLQTTQSKYNSETLSALEIAEQMTYLDHEIFVAIRSEEFLGQKWTKPEKYTLSPHVALMSTRFNEVSNLIVTDAITQPNQTARIACMEKWAAVGDICRVLHNFNGVMQVCSAFNNAALFRLKKTYDKMSKTV